MELDSFIEVVEFGDEVIRKTQSTHYVPYTDKPDADMLVGDAQFLCILKPPIGLLESLALVFLLVCIIHTVKL